MSETDDLKARVESLKSQLERMRERERYFANALSVADGGQFQADWDGAIRRLLEKKRNLVEFARWCATKWPHDDCASNFGCRRCSAMAWLKENEAVK